MPPNRLSESIATRDRRPLFLGGRTMTTGAWFPVAHPATGATVAEVADADPDLAWVAADTAAAAFPSWAAAPPRERAELLRRAFDLMVERREALAATIILETGRPVREANAEVAYAAEFLRWFAEEAVRVGGEHRLAPDGSTRIITTRRPVGPCLLVTPWNFPAAMVTRKLGAALAAGCTAIVKPAEQTPLTALAIAQLLVDADLPPGVLSVLPTTQPGPLVKRLLDHPGLRKLSFTGSTAVGRHLLELAARPLLRTSMELGGNAPFAVLADADVEAAAAGAVLAKMRNGGQACVAANRFYVHDSVLDAFREAFVRRMAALREGPLADAATELGSLIDDGAVQRVAALVDEAVDGGGSLLLGGGRPDRPGSWYEPTVIADVPPNAAIVRTEIFGPVAPIVSFADEEELAALVNAAEAGLAAYVYAADARQALGVLESWDVGMVGINRGFVSNPAAPFGGLRSAGFGREGGREGLEDYVDVKYAALDV